MAPPAPRPPPPDDAAFRAKKFDRQLRVWGADGQAALEAARVLLLGAGAVGAEALKNLVLGGVAGFTVVDDAKVREGGRVGWAGGWPENRRRRPRRPSPPLFR